MKPTSPLDAFPMVPAQSGGLSALRKAMKPVKPKPASAVAMKRAAKAAAKAMEEMGKTVGAITVTPEGSVTLTAGAPSQTEQVSYWDKAVQK